MRETLPGEMRDTRKRETIEEKANSERETKEYSRAMK